jgi:hypothetical protein
MTTVVGRGDGGGSGLPPGLLLPTEVDGEFDRDSEGRPSDPSNSKEIMADSRWAPSGTPLPVREVTVRTGEMSTAADAAGEPVPSAVSCGTLITTSMSG